MKLPKNDAFKLMAGGGVDGYSYVTLNIIDEWRWGNVYELIISDSEGKFWATTYQEQSGDNYYNSLEDYSEVEFYQVEAVEVKTVEYRKIKD